MAKHAFLYVVRWPAVGVVKIGYTDHLRRRTARYICRRGGVLLSSRRYDDYADAFVAEDAAAAVMSAWPKAFADRHEGEPYLGGRGSGWTECYLVPDEELDECVDAVMEATQ